MTLLTNHCYTSALPIDEALWRIHQLAVWNDQAMAAHE